MVLRAKLAKYGPLPNMAWLDRLWTRTKLGLRARLANKSIPIPGCKINKGIITVNTSNASADNKDGPTSKIPDTKIR